MRRTAHRKGRLGLVSCGVPTLSERLVRRIERDFTEHDAVDVVRLVSELAYGERVQAGVVLSARGNLERLRDAASLARIDWRDVLIGAELADEDWPDKLDRELGLNM